MLCPYCKKEVNPKISKSGPHFKAECNICNKYIKFLSKTELKELVEKERLKKSSAYTEPVPESSVYLEPVPEYTEPVPVHTAQPTQNDIFITELNERVIELSKQLNDQEEDMISFKKQVDFLKDIIQEIQDRDENHV